MMLEADVDTVASNTQRSDDCLRRWAHPSQFLCFSLSCLLPVSGHAHGKTAVTGLLFLPSSFFSFSCPFGVLFVVCFYTAESQDVATHFSAVTM